MSNLLVYETLVGQVGAEGVTCLMALAIESPQPLSDLAALIKREARKATAVLERLMRYGYVGPVAPLDLTVWHITNKGREMLGAFFRLFIGRGSDPRQLTLPLSGSDPVQFAHTAVGSNPSAQEVEGIPGVTRAARAPIIHSDHDQIFDQNQNHELNESEHAARNLPAVAAALDRHGIRDLPGKPNRTTLLQDAWVTPERIDAAIDRARHNPKRLSPSPVGLAVAELLHHRPEIDDVVASLQHPEIRNQQSAISTEDDQVPIVAGDDRLAQLWQVAKGELYLEMTRATFDTWVKNSDCVSYEEQTGTYIIAVPNNYAADWMQGRLNSTCARILSGIVGEPRKVRFVVWKTWAKQNSTN